MCKKNKANSFAYETNSERIRITHSNYMTKNYDDDDEEVER